MKLFHYILLIFFFIIGFESLSQPSGEQNFTVVFYNTENLFDIQDDPAINDADFLPTARVPWTGERYELKLDRLAQVLSSIHDGRLPAVIGLCEVENQQVLDDLISQKSLKKGGYGIVHFDSPDERGIDNALLYRKSAFVVLTKKAIPVKLTQNPGDATRDILYVSGVVKKSPSDTLHLFVNHWPSRRGGQSVSEPNRLDAATTLRHHVDSIFSIHGSASILIMGDFNDEPGDRSLAGILQALAPTPDPMKNTLYNLMRTASMNGKGTIYYDGWQLFDQIIVSGRLLSKTSGLTLPVPEGEIFSAEWLLYKPAHGEARPNRTAAKDYYGGYSDHLPVFIDFLVR